MIGIYKITNKITKQIYIGKSVNIEQRWIEHKCPKPKHNLKLHEDMKKYGVKNFVFEIIEECKETELSKKELFYIKSLKPFYNSIGKQVSEETKEKIRLKIREWWLNLDEKTKEKIISKNLTGPKKGHIVTEETRKKLRNANIGKTQTKETINKRKNTFLEKKKNGWKRTNSSHKKKVICVETKQVYDSIKDAAIAIGVHPSNITSVLKGRQKTCKSYHFEYVV